MIFPGRQDSMLKIDVSKKIFTVLERLYEIVYTVEIKAILHQLTSRRILPFPYDNAFPKQLYQCKKTNKSKHGKNVSYFPDILNHVDLKSFTCFTYCFKVNFIILLLFENY